MKPFVLGCLFLTVAAVAGAQTPAPIQLVQPQGTAAPPPVITLQDALERAKKLDVPVQAAVSDSLLAREDRVQAKNSLRPSVINSTQYLGTQGNGVSPSGRFVTNDGVHVYREWGVVHQELSAETFLTTGYQRAEAAEILAQAKVEIAQRGLVVTVTKNYYALVIAQRKYASAQAAVQQAMRFLEITQQNENAGQVAHSDVVKAQIQYEQQTNTFQDATLEMSNARLSLAVLLFSTLNENFTVVDDLDSPRALPAFTDIQSMAARENPDLRAAEQALRQSTFDVRGAKNAMFPSLSLEGIYGIEANAFALRSVVAATPQFGPLPNPGYFVTASLSIPIFDWGTRRSKISQAQIHEQQARVSLNQTQRQLVANLYLYYNEATAALASVDRLRRIADLADQSLRLINLRYDAGESTALEVVDAQKTLLDARNAYDDAQARYRVSLATLQTLTGNFQ
jgi:outer membrane protein TolC